MKRAIVLALLIVFNFSLQSTVFGFHNMNSITPNLLLILTMSFGLMRGRKEGILVGFFSGFLVDCFFNSVLGPYMFLYMVFGYMNGFFHKNYMIEDVMLPFIVILIDDFAFNTIIYILFFFLNNRLQYSKYFTGVILPEMLSTALLTIILYKLYVVINKKLKQREEGNES